MPQCQVAQESIKLKSLAARAVPTTVGKGKSSTQDPDAVSGLKPRLQLQMPPLASNPNFARHDVEFCALQGYRSKCPPIPQSFRRRSSTDSGGSISSSELWEVDAGVAPPDLQEPALWLVPRAVRRMNQQLIRVRVPLSPRGKLGLTIQACPMRRHSDVVPDLPSTKVVAELGAQRNNSGLSSVQKSNDDNKGNPRTHRCVRGKGKSRKANRAEFCVANLTIQCCDEVENPHLTRLVAKGLVGPGAYIKFVNGVFMDCALTFKRAMRHIRYAARSAMNDEEEATARHPGSSTGTATTAAAATSRGPWGVNVAFGTEVILGLCPATPAPPAARATKPEDVHTDHF